MMNNINVTNNNRLMNNANNLNANNLANNLNVNNMINDNVLNSNNLDVNNLNVNNLNTNNIANGNIVNNGNYAGVNDSSTILKVAPETKNIPVDINSEVPLHERWNCEHSRVPKSAPNGGLFGGEQAVGPYASIHVVPTTTNMINRNLLSANPPPGAEKQYPGTNRSNNNYVPMPGVYWYNDTHPVNKGPFSMKVVHNEH